MLSQMIEFWMKFMPIIETTFDVLCILAFLYLNIVMDNWKLVEN